jgi:hypothetical protein
VLFPFPAYLVTCHVLSLSGANVSNTSLTRKGDLFLRHPAYVLGVESVGVNKKIRASLLRFNFHVFYLVILINYNVFCSSKTPPFYLPCFAHVVGEEASTEQQDFEGLVEKAFLSLRNHAAFLVYSVTVTARQLGLSEDVVRDDRCVFGVRDFVLIIPLCRLKPVWPCSRRISCYTWCVTLIVFTVTV